MTLTFSIDEEDQRPGVCLREYGMEEVELPTINDSSVEFCYKVEFKKLLVGGTPLIFLEFREKWKFICNIYKYIKVTYQADKQINMFFPAH